MKERFILGNAFSLQMLTGTTDVQVKKVSVGEVKEILSTKPFESIIGHSDTANVLTSSLGVIVGLNRSSIKLDVTDTLIVAQLEGGRLPEGATTLPDGYNFKFMLVRLIANWNVRSYAQGERKPNDFYFRCTYEELLHQLKVKGLDLNSVRIQSVIGPALRTTTELEAASWGEE